MLKISHGLPLKETQKKMGKIENPQQQQILSHSRLAVICKNEK